MMTKKHFIEMAKMISEIPEGEHKEKITDLMVVMFRKLNPRFKEDVLREACQPS